MGLIDSPIEIKKTYECVSVEASLRVYLTTVRTVIRPSHWDVYINSLQQHTSSNSRGDVIAN